jgi:transcriptional regulator with XRE-family HTH domain
MAGLPLPLPKRHGSGRYVVRANAPTLLREARERERLSQARLGQLMLCPSEAAGQTLVKRLESGREVRDSPSYVANMMNAAAAMGLPVEDVIEWSSEAAP